MNDDMRKIVKIGIGVMAFLVVVSLAKLTPKNEAVTLDNYTPDITTEDITTEVYTETTELTEEYTTEEIQENNLIVPEGREDEFFAEEITIPRNITVGEDGTVTVIEPARLDSDLADVNDKEERKRRKNERMVNIGAKLVDLYENEDRSWSLIYDEESLENNYSYLESMFNYEFQEAYNKVSLTLDFKEIILYLRDDATLFGFGMDILRLKWCAIAGQIYSGVPYDEWTIHLEVVYEETGELMYEFDFSEEDYEYNITEEEWNQKLEEMKENATAIDAIEVESTY